MHCGVADSPQWRRGPPNKPVLCNACGTRFRRTNQLNLASSYNSPRSVLSRKRSAEAAAALGEKQQSKEPRSVYVACEA
ncbi:hypothetical protein WJX72_011528 [[Myrmecia] bisecta]|uniref:GATA-type domain-containing protein n=1 Tax=[Myrmecia] bisecta TaxID=41462 RepID=A0AAW1QBF4_9CHLO